MSVDKLAAFRTFALASALVVAVVLAMSPLSPHSVAAEGWGSGTVRDHRARLCRATYNPHPSTPSYPSTFSLCAVRGTAPVGSFCTCSVRIENRYVTAPGKILLASSP